VIKEEYMRRAIELAKRATGFTNPNPLVGVVIVKEDRIIGEGYHEKCGQLHAERNAFASLKESAEGATLYVTLEPCCHYGKTPPCTEAIVENKIARVVMVDVVKDRDIIPAKVVYVRNRNKRKESLCLISTDVNAKATLT
jgi:diaminohydroxyphosphoribosylaminopyrimidine deaminase / 5-amino-6-(5-phosphoribosylamino)uracil reductase